ncbi:hypothetical protein BDP27DRAFT_1253518 [Rhodocollybia butyracea]|uniref:PBP domain-containing protein n=1 Tax=Rhodocollybia butyracea TaxID=206335 RepID=A0A9P5Q8K8_9AGAR|nr:hypothetical protein BDP27DRAFT_1253518 [Rhodocollybia butyracea]
MAIQPIGTVVVSTQASSPSTLTPAGTYNGGYKNAQTVRLRIGNGGAGQAGLVGELADAFIRWWCVQGPGSKSPHEAPFLVEWYLGDTTQSLSYLSTGWVDIALTYNEAAEMTLIRKGSAVERQLVFFDHFYIVGPPSNPAGLCPEDSVLDISGKIVVSGNQDILIPPDSTVRPPTRFLTRFDKSATNIKENELFIAIGQVPWALPPALWYHIYPRFPAQALHAASVLQEYTLTDRGMWLSGEKGVRDGLKVYKGKLNLGANNSTLDDHSESDDTVLLNPCSALLGASARDKQLATQFMQWLIAPDGGQKVIKEFVKNGEQLFQPRFPGV